MRSTRSRITAVVSGAATVLAGVTLADVARAQDLAPQTTAARDALTLLPGFAGLPDSLGVSAPTVLHGRVTDSSGLPMRGAAVLLSAWPSNETMRAMPVGGTFQLTPIARTATGGDGGYELRAGLTALLAPLVGQDGLDVQLDVFHAGRQYTWLSQVRPSGSGWVLPSVTETLDRATGKATARNTLNLAFGRVHGSDIASDLKFAAAWAHHADDDNPGSNPGPHPFPGAWCVQRKAAERETMTTVATALARAGTTAHVTYDRGAQTMMSAGLSWDKGVSFRISGDRTRTSNFEAGYKPKRGAKGNPAHHAYKINMVNGVIQTECMGNEPGEIRIRQVVTDPMGPGGGGKPVPIRGPIWKCANVEPAGFGYVQTENAEAHTFSKGFSFSPLGLGAFTGEALSGYSTTVRVKYTFKSENGRWCGDTGRPLDKGQLTQAFEK